MNRKYIGKNRKYLLFQMLRMLGSKNYSKTFRFSLLTVVLFLSSFFANAQISVTATAGTLGPTTYTTLGAAFAAINAGTHQGVINVSITTSGTITETSACVLNQSAFPSSYSSILIKPATGVTATITGNIPVNGVIYLNGASNVTIDGSNTVGGTTRNLTITNTNASVSFWYAGVRIGSPSSSVGATNDTLKNCNIIGTASATASIGICSGTGTTLPASAEAQNSNNAYINNSVNTWGYNMIVQGEPTLTDAGTLINGNTLGACYFREMWTQDQSNIDINGNTISGMSTASGGFICGILVTGSYSGNVRNNNISAINYPGTAGTGYGAYGIYLDANFGSTSINVYNNFIYGISSSGYAGTGHYAFSRGGHGIYVDWGTGYNIFHNSIDLTTSSAGGTSAAIMINDTFNTANQLNLKNNIIANTQAAGGSTRYGLYCNNPIGTFGSIDYNDYWATGGGTLANLAGTACGTIALIRTNFGSNLHSVNGNPNFTSATNLHINRTCVQTSVLESGGAWLGITTDIDGQTRPGPTGSACGATAPDIGADEFASALNDAVPPTISYTTIPHTCSTGDVILSGVTITDGTGVPTTGATVPQIYFKKNAGAWFHASGTLTSGTATNGTWSFTITAATMGGVAGGDVISYYVIAQDIALPSIISEPSAGLVATNVNTVTTPPTTPNFYTIGATLNGTYTVGGGGAYGTVTAAVAAYNTGCLTGPVIFSLTDAAYPSETFPLTIQPNSTASTTNTLTIKPAVGISPTITCASATDGDFFILGNNIIIDGSNVTAGTTQNLTISNTSTGGIYCVRIGSPTTTMGATNNVIKNCILTNGGNLTATACVLDGSGTTLYANAEYPNSNCIIQNNTMSNAQDGVFQTGCISNPDSAVVVTGNTITNIGAQGVYLSFTKNSSVDANNINNINGNFLPDIECISIGGAISNLNIFNNKLNTINNPAADGAYGIYLTAYTGSSVKVYNNFIYDVVGAGTVGATQALLAANGYGIYVDQGTGYNFYHNTVNMTTNQTTGTSAAFMVNYTTPVTNGMNVMNNIFANNQTSGSTRYGIYSSNPNTTFNSIDNNDYYASSGNYGYLTSALTTLALIQSGLGSNIHSVVVSPPFISATNPHITTGCSIGTQLESGGFNVGILTDIDGQTRPGPLVTACGGTQVDIGADEFDANIVDLTPPTIVYTLLPSIECTAMNVVLSGVNITDATGVPTTGATVPQIYFKKNAGAWFHASGTLTSGISTNGIWSFTINSATLGGVTSGDIISYYVIAQDLASTPNIDANPNTGLVASNVNTVTTPPTTPNTYTVNLPGLTGIALHDTICYDASSTTTGSYSYTGVTGGANQYTLVWAPLGPTPVSTFTAIPASPITVSVPAGTTAGIYSGTLTIKNLATGCDTVVTLTLDIVNMPTPITGTDSVCLYATTILADAITGGTWSSVTTTVATVNPVSGVVTGVGVGTSVISYSIGSCLASVIVTVNNAPVAITGPTSFCNLATITLADVTTGGTWTSSNTTVATITTGGVLTAADTGITTITYAIGSCQVTKNDTVRIQPDIITGTDSVCMYSTTVLGDITTGGTWSSVTTTIATVNPITGVVYGAGAGTSVISYTIGTCTSTVIVTVNLTPAAIGGPNSVCNGLNVTLTDVATGGTWSSSNTTIASITTAGVVTGNNVGTDTITYQIGSCFVTKVITVNIQPAPITGIDSVCMFSTTALGDITTGGTWSSVTTTVATVNPVSGVVYGAGAGTSVISYTVGTCASTVPVTVHITPAAIGGPNSVCEGSTINLTNVTTGGTWSSSNILVASITTGGVVTGNIAGTDTITYEIGSCFVTKVITVNIQPAAITGTDSVCRLSTTLLSDVTTGGTWSSVTTLVATVNPVSGLVYGAGVGTSIISYTIGTCASTVTVTVHLTPVGILGPNTVCNGSTINLTDGTTGGTWSSSNNSVATITTGGVVTGNSVGVDTITYQIGSCFVTKVITVTVQPAPITGVDSVCMYSNITLNDIATGGTWSSVTTSVATVNPVSGVVYGAGAGTSLISYTIGTCASTVTVTVHLTPTAIGGPNAVCHFSTINLTDATTGGTWLSSNNLIATVTTGGVVTGVNVGVDTITYEIGSCFVTKVITVNVQPGPILGIDSVCVSAHDTLIDTVLGGTWTSVSLGVATISGTGVVTGGAVGTSVISYAIGSCYSVVTITVDPLPNAGTITGASSVVCVGSNIVLGETATGGIWSSSNSFVASVTGGTVTGVGAGTDTISYTYTNSCGTAVAIRVITVNPLPVLPATITGVDSVCVGANTTLYDATTGAVWSSVSTAICTVNPFGVVHGIAAGTSIISYTYSNSCGILTTTVTVTVDPLPNAGTIMGVGSVCVGSITTLSDLQTGGIWSSSATGIAGIGSTGLVTGSFGGTATISYSYTNSCGTAVTTSIVTVNPLPVAGTITGIDSVCVGSNITLSDLATGGTWSSQTFTIATVTTGGVVHGAAAGVDSIVYTVSNICGTTHTAVQITVNSLPTTGVITGSASICESSTATYSDLTTGGTWSVACGGVMVISGTGVVSALSPGVCTISYTETNGCGSTSATLPVTVLPLPAIPTAISGTFVVCQGANVTLSDAVTGGSWTMSSTTVASINSAGIVTGNSTGIDTVNYTISNGCGSNSVSATITVNPLPNAGTISGTLTTCTGSTTTLTDGTTGGTWSSISTSVCTINPISGVVSGLTSGTSLISYSVTNSCGTAVANATVTVNTLPSAGTITGPTSVCTGNTITLSDISTGGVWSSSRTTVASVNSFGVVTGSSGDTATIQYKITNSCGSDSTTKIITVYVSPVAIVGANNVCVGDSILFTDATTGGNWSTTSLSATVSATGRVRGITGGTALISYTVGTGCMVTKPVTINTAPVLPAIAGSSVVCIGSNITLSNAMTGGTWTIANSNATVISGINCVVGGVVAGKDTVVYTLSNSCGTSTITKPITVNALPVSGVITMQDSVICVGVHDTLTVSVTGGTWLSNFPAIASIGAANGIAIGLSAGIDTIIYKVTNVCGTARTKVPLTVNPLPNAGSITGISILCVSNMAILSDTASGGTWTSSNGSVSISGGAVTAVYTGVDTIGYTVTNSCGTATATHYMTVNPLPFAGTISGTNTLCVGAAVVLTDTASGGSWSLANTNVSMAGSGITRTITGVNAGYDTVTYSVVNSCGTATTTFNILVNPLPFAGAVTGLDSVCVGSSVTFSDSATGGNWSAINLRAGVTSGGVVIGNFAGKDSIYYTVINSCGTASAMKTIFVKTLPIAGTITGPDSVCVGSTISLMDSASGGSWSATNSDAALVPFAYGGLVTGNSAGIDTFFYQSTNSCGSSTTTKFVVINPLPNAGTISGVDTLCVGSITTLLNAATGGNWTATTAHASILPITGGVKVTAVSGGNDSIFYTVTNSCGTQTAVASLQLVVPPVAGVISGADSVCVGSTLTLNDFAGSTGGIWSATNSNASMSGNVATGMYTGYDTVLYTIGNFCGTVSASYPIKIKTVPNRPSISAISWVCVGKRDTLNGLPSGGIWTITNPSKASLTTGVLVYVTGLLAGSDTVVYTVSNFCGPTHDTLTLSILTSHQCDSINLVPSITNINDEHIRIYPNPANGQFTVELPENAENTTIAIFDMYGKEVANYQFSDRTMSKAELNPNISAGTYLIKVISDGRVYKEKIVIW